MERQLVFRGGCKLVRIANGTFISIHDASVKDIDAKVASTICSRYYKGLGTNGDNMVLEIYKDKA